MKNINYDMKKTTEDLLEGTVGGSFLDDLLGLLDYPTDIEWFENTTHVEAHSNGKIWRRSKTFMHGFGQYEEEWISIKN
jgi:hypothetical protein